MRPIFWRHSVILPVELHSCLTCSLWRNKFYKLSACPSLRLRCQIEVVFHRILSDRTSGLRIYRLCRPRPRLSTMQSPRSLIWFPLWYVPAAGWHWTRSFADRLRFYRRYTVGRRCSATFSATTAAEPPTAKLPPLTRAQ